MGILSWDDAIARQNCTTATTVMLNNLQPQDETPQDQVKWVNIRVRLYQGDKWFTHSQDMNVVKDRFLEKLERIKSSDFIDPSKTVVELPKVWDWHEETRITVALKDDEDFVDAVEALMR